MIGYLLSCFHIYTIALSPACPHRSMATPTSCVVCWEPAGKDLRLLPVKIPDSRHFGNSGEAPCDHFCCDGCIRQHVDIAIAEGRIRINCPACPKTLTNSDIRRLTTVNCAERHAELATTDFRARPEREELLKLPDVRECTSCHVLLTVPQHEILCGTVCCRTCNTYFRWQRTDHDQVHVDHDQVHVHHDWWSRWLAPTGGLIINIYALRPPQPPSPPRLSWLASLPPLLPPQQTPRVPYHQLPFTSFLAWMAMVGRTDLNGDTGQEPLDDLRSAG